MLPDRIICLMERAAPVLILGVALYILARKIGWTGLAKLLVRLGAGLLLLIVAASIVPELPHESPQNFFACWLLVSLPIYVLKRRHDSADARDAHREHLRQARGHERRRAPAPLGHGAPPPANQNPTQTTGGTP